MYIVGFIKDDRPKVLINPKLFKSFPELWDFYQGFFNTTDFVMEPMITEADLLVAVQADEPLIIPFKGHHVSLMLGDDSVVANAIERPFFTDKFNY